MKLSIFHTDVSVKLSVCHIDGSVTTEYAIAVVLSNLVSGALSECWWLSLTLMVQWNTVSDCEH